MIDHRGQVFAQPIKLLALRDITQDPLDRIGFIEFHAAGMHFHRHA